MENKIVGGVCREPKTAFIQKYGIQYICYEEKPTETQYIHKCQFQTLTP